MRFSDFAGNDDVKKALAGMIDSGRVPHAILFHEDDGGGAMRIVLAFLQYLYCRNRSGGNSCMACPSCNKVAKLIHPDIHFIFPIVADKLPLAFISQWRELVNGNPDFAEAELAEALGIETKSSVIAVGTAKALLDTLSLSALEGGYRSVVIYLPEKLNQEAANRLLKIIEEPPMLTQFLLITHQPEKVLPTIASRCQRIRVVAQRRILEDPQEDMELFAELMDAAVRRSLPDLLGVGERMASLPSRERARAFCGFMSAQLRRIFLLQQGMQQMAGIPDSQLQSYSQWAALLRKNFPRKALEAVDRASAMIARNVNIRIVFTDLCDNIYINAQ